MNPMKIAGLTAGSNGAKTGGLAGRMLGLVALYEAEAPYSATKPSAALREVAQHSARNSAMQRSGATKGGWQHA